MDGQSPKIKFCGMTRLQDAELAAAAGAWAIGLIFWPGSRRRCRLEDAGAIAAALKRRIEVVGVFVNASLQDVVRTADAVELTMVQLHGDEGPVFCGEVARRTGCKVIKAAPVRSGADIQALSPFHTDYHLLDGHAPGLRGGTGETFAWELARRHRGSVPLILSGGLRPENVAEAIEVVRPFAVDVATGVELSPGIKDPGRLTRFAQAVASTAAAAESGSSAHVAAAASADPDAGSPIPAPR